MIAMTLFSLARETTDKTLFPDGPSVFKPGWWLGRRPMEGCGLAIPALIQPIAEPKTVTPTAVAETPRNPGVTPHPDEAIREAREASKEPYDSCFSLYMRDIGWVKLLTPQEEVELAARIRAGDQEARDRMIKANLRLVIKIARRYEGLGVPLEDLISEGNIGLVKAVEHFDPAKGGKLSSYSALWIKQAIARALAAQSNPTRLPMHLMDKLNKMRKASLRLRGDLGREPNDLELAAELATTAARVARWRRATVAPVSLDAPIAEEDSCCYAELIADDKAEMPDKNLESKAVRAMIWKMVETLTRREKAVLISRFGLGGQEPKNLEETGMELRVTDERVRQIQNSALLKLRRRIKQLEHAPLELNACAGRLLPK
jgi:RNA polymerase primary sigma factor